MDATAGILFNVTGIGTGNAAVGICCRAATAGVVDVCSPLVNCTADAYAASICAGFSSAIADAVASVCVDAAATGVCACVIDVGVFVDHTVLGGKRQRVVQKIAYGCRSACILARSPF